MARETGLEPATSSVTGRRSNQLSYSRVGTAAISRDGYDLFLTKLHDKSGSATNPKNLVGDDGLEPPTFSV